jgi:signal transduction histidine kinase
VFRFDRQHGLRDVALRYAGAVAITLLIVALRVALDPVLGRQNNRHLVLLPGVMLTAWFGGFGPGVVAAGLDALALGLFWPSAGRVLPARAMAPDLVLFLVLGVAVSALIESLRAARARADSATIARDKMLAIVAHDLRNPLNLISLASGVLRRLSAESDAARAKVDLIDRAVKRMDRLIRDLVDATHIERDELSVSLGDVGVADVLRELMESFRPSALEKGIDLHIDVPSADVIVRADRDRLVQVFGNLVGNALKFTGAGGTVGVQTSPRDDEICFEVDDTGPGIRPEHLQHVFERFWKSGGGGIGLGLFIARSVVAAHGGTLGVRSVLGQGATFFFSIPRSAVVAPAVPFVPSPSRVANR